TLGPVKRGLGSSKTNALQHWAQRQRHMPAQPFRQQRRLIKPALALFRRMQRNGNNRIETAFAKTFVVERGHQPARDQMAKMNLASVFKIENDVANDSAASVSRNRGVERSEERRVGQEGRCRRSDSASTTQAP